jgi:hypothetical protein
VYSSPHGIEQDRRDFMRENPNLYAYIALREAAKALDTTGDAISGHHAAANAVWRASATVRARYEAMQTAPARTLTPEEGPS